MKTSRIIHKNGKIYFGMIYKYRPDLGDPMVIFADYDRNKLFDFNVNDLAEFITQKVWVNVDSIEDQDHLKEAREYYKTID